MALCRFAYCSPASSAPTFIRFPKYPSKHVKFSLLPFSFATMEAPPEGYRRNVGICLMNAHKKVRSLVRSKSLCFWFPPFIHQSLMIRVFADFRCFEARHSQCLANAAGVYLLILLCSYLSLWIEFKTKNKFKIKLHFGPELLGNFLVAS